MFLPLTKEEFDASGMVQADFIFVTGDAYVDHPSFGTAILSRVLEAEGYSVAIIAQPDYKSVTDFKRFGRPRLGFLVNSGNIDSMVAHYTASKKPRNDDYYSPGGVKGKRPDRAVIVYCNRIREAYGDIPIVIGGIEASTRRFAHYDYWTDKVRRSILIDSTADILAFGMGQSQYLWSYVCSPKDSQCHFSVCDPAYCGLRFCRPSPSDGCRKRRKYDSDAGGWFFRFHGRRCENSDHGGFASVCL